MSTIGATTLGEILPSSMGATTLDAVAEVVGPRHRVVRTQARRPSPKRRGAVSPSPRTHTLKERVQLEMANVAEQRKHVALATSIARKAETQRKAARRRLEMLERRLKAARASAATHAAKKKATPRRARR